MRKIHKIKLNKKFHKLKLNNLKNFEIRLNDRNYQIKDYLYYEAINYCEQIIDIIHFPNALRNNYIILITKKVNISDLVEKSEDEKQVIYCMQGYSQIPDE